MTEPEQANPLDPHLNRREANAVIAASAVANPASLVSLPAGKTAGKMAEAALSGGFAAPSALFMEAYRKLAGKEGKGSLTELALISDRLSEMQQPLIDLDNDDDETLVAELPQRPLKEADVLDLWKHVAQISQRIAQDMKALLAVPGARDYIDAHIAERQRHREKIRALQLQSIGEAAPSMSQEIMRLLASPDRADRIDADNRLFVMNPSNWHIDAYGIINEYCSDKKKTKQIAKNYNRSFITLVRQWQASMKQIHQMLENDYGLETMMDGFNMFNTQELTLAKHSHILTSPELFVERQREGFMDQVMKAAPDFAPSRAELDQKLKEVEQEKIPPLAEASRYQRRLELMQGMGMIDISALDNEHPAGTSLSPRWQERIAAARHRAQEKSVKRSA